MITIEIYNSTDSSNSTQQKELTARDFALFSLTLISMVGLIGNSVAIYIMNKSKRIHKSACFSLLVNQSVADIATCGTSFIWIATHDLLPKSDMSGTADWIMCSFVQNQFLLSTTIIVSSYNLCLVSVERMISIVFPVFHRIHMNKRHIRRAIYLLWLLGILIMLCFSLPTNGIKSNGDCHFWSKFSNKQSAYVYSITFITVYNILPVAVMLVSYIMIYLTLSGAGSLTSFKSNVVKMLATCVFAYLLCHGLRSFMTIAASYDPLRFSLTGSFYVIATVLMQANSAVNPIIYIFQNKDYRKELRRQLYRLVGFNYGNEVLDISITSHEELSIS